MGTLQSVPHVVIARVHGLATAAECQLVASCDLAVAGESAGFALPGGAGGWFCPTPAVPVARVIGRKRLMQLALTGEPIDAGTALDWGLVNAVVPDEQLDAEVDDLLARATPRQPGVQGSRQAHPIRPAGPPEGGCLRHHDPAHGGRPADPRRTRRPPGADAAGSRTQCILFGTTRAVVGAPVLAVRRRDHAPWAGVES